MNYLSCLFCDQNKKDMGIDADLCGYNFFSKSAKRGSIL